ncbi:site-specific integrase [Aliarcobacter butzleri]|uniref:tyrosine-type recombinase/integrase n=1 Tax=Aliarcobacter butzleri TaxID=28197 RepID=UPI001EDA9A5F|nr:site-specific integrase [Aliarcobacter butzleri]MCG3678928.1 site-specific integrase [Aliarcobacter butzleri]
MKKKKFTKIRENITEVEYQKLLIYLNSKEDLTTNTKNNLRRTFILLYFIGMRINEVKQLKVKDVNTIFEKEELIIVIHKTRKERKLFFSKEAIKQIKKHFVFNDNSKDEDFIITTKGNTSKTPNSSTFIAKVNSFIQEVLGHRYSSHSFRVGIITDMSKSINPKFIKEFIGHSDMRYIKPVDEDLKKSLIR